MCFKELAQEAVIEKLKRRVETEHEKYIILSGHACGSIGI